MHLVDPATRDFVELTGTDGPRLRHLPGLDGLRGIAVVVVVAFHAGFDRMVGGFLGVSTFFTLSGFLITSLLLSEARHSGGVELRSFWGRRFRRLLPASLATLAAIVLVFMPLVATADQRSNMRGDVLSALFDVANWHDILADTSYAELFAAPSPVLHFWSLSIEEQFYLLFPPLLVGLWIAARGRTKLLAVAFGALAVVSALEPVIWSMSDDRVYFGTDTRAAELLIGSLLALVLAHEPLRRRLALRLRWRTTALTLGVLALAVQAWWWWTLPQGTWWLYRGGFAGYALLTCLVITAAALPAGPIHAVMTRPTLRWFGARSYGIYLVHWPLFLAVRQTWPGASRWTVTVVAVGASLVLAEASFRWIETPVRMGRWPSPARTAQVALGAVAFVGLIAFIPFPVDDAQLTPDFARSQDELDRLVGDDAPGRGTDPLEGSPSEAPTDPRVVIVGDSTAIGGAMGYDMWLTSAGRAGLAGADARLGCGVARVRTRKVDTVSENDAACTGWPARWGELLAAHDPDVVILFATFWEIPDVQLPGSDEWTSIGDPDVDRFLETELLEAVDVLSSTGATVVVVTWPDFGDWAADGRPDAVARQVQPERIERYREIQRAVVDQRPDTSRLVDLADWLGPRSQDRSLRSDGTHFIADDFAEVTGEWFGPQIDRIWSEQVDAEGAGA